MQIVLTDDHVALLREAVHGYAPEADAEGEYAMLEAFVDAVAEHPEAFPVTGRMAASIKTRLRKINGPAQPQSRKNKRKDRQERRMRTAKARRATRREDAEKFNEALKRIEDELKEMAEIERERGRRIETLAAKDEFTFSEVMELLEHMGLGPIVDELRSEHELTDQERIDRAAARAA